MDNLQQRLDRIFHPRVVAVVGAKKANEYSWLRNHGPVEELGGKIYHVNIDRDEWPGAEELGFTNVTSLHDIPDPVDYVAISVPANVVPNVLRDCVDVGVGGAHIFAAGFSETRTSQGMQLEERVARVARESGLTLVGPNCMGLYNPGAGIRQDRQQPYGETGFFSYISQSGTTAMAFGQAAPASGIKVAKGVSFGNGTVLDCTDFLDYLGQDADTEMIGMYLEGVRDGRRFFEALRYAAARKPVMIWKVGQSPDSARAGAAHTASAPVSPELWDAMLRQCGAIKANGMEEILDTAVALRYLRSIDPRVALIAVSGGHSGKIADVFGQQGFLIPSPSDGSLQEIASYSEIMGGSYTNPFEGPSVRTEENLGRTLDVLDRDPGIDTIVVEVAAGNIKRSTDFVEKRLETLTTYAGRHTTPVMVVLTTDIPYTEGVDTKPIERQFLAEGIACFNGMERGARALRSALDYHRQRSWLSAERSPAHPEGRR